ncbi:hypothetical protein NQZ68_010635 [Dissostichus eleginoides]|nr:hypothetical protein NQZ68_010635 [Dissostichus eleginoides]
MRDSVRLLQMSLHWHMTGERHFKFLTGRDISPKPHTARAHTYTHTDRQTELAGPPPLTQSHETVAREPRKLRRRVGASSGQASRVQSVDGF